MKMSKRFVVSGEGREKNPVQEIGGRVVWVERDRLRQFFLASCPIEVVVVENQAQGRVGLREAIVDLEGFRRRGPGLGKGIRGRQEAVAAHDRVGIRETGMGE